MTTQTISCYKGFPVKISARARGYWDYEEIKSFDTAQTYNVSLKPYEDLKYSFNESPSTTISIDFQPSVLPNNKWGPFESRILLPYDNDKIYHNTKAKRKNYYFSNVGCWVSENNVLSGFSKLAYAQISRAFPKTFSSLKMIFKVTTESSLFSHNNCLFGNAGSASRGLYILSNTRFAYYTGSWTEGKTTLKSSTTYWFCVNYANETFTGYFLEDDGNYTLDTLPELNEWNEEWTSNINIFAENIFNLGHNKNSTNDYFAGNFDLNNFKIWLDGDDFWYYNMITEVKENLKGALYHYEDTGAAVNLNCFYCNNAHILSPDENVDGGLYLGQVSIPKHDVYSYHEEPYPVYDNFTFVGTPINVQGNGTCNGFSSSSYLDTGYCPSLPNNTPWRMRVKFNYNATTVTQYFLAPSDYKYGMYISTQSSHKLDSGICSSGTSFGNIVSDFTLENGVNYTVEWVYDGNETYTLRCKKEDEGFTDVGTIITEKAIIVKGNLFIGKSGSAYCRGDIDLSDTFFEINGVKTWIPTTMHYKTTWTRK